MICNYLILWVFYIRIGGAGIRKPYPKARPPLNLPLEKGEELRAVAFSGNEALLAASTGSPFSRG